MNFWYLRATAFSNDPLRLMLDWKSAYLSFRALSCSNWHFFHLSPNGCRDFLHKIRHHSHWRSVTDDYELAALQLRCTHLSLFHLSKNHCLPCVYRSVNAQDPLSMRIFSIICLRDSSCSLAPHVMVSISRVLKDTSCSLAQYIMVSVSRTLSVEYANVWHPIANVQKFLLQEPILRLRHPSRRNGTRSLSSWTK